MVYAATVGRPRAVTGAVVSRVSDAGAWSRTCDNLLSLNRVYNYGMTNVIERRRFSELGDQQLLEQTRRLAANQRCLEVHILDHLDEIDRRGLALRRGFSSLFDYAVRELRFSDAAAQRRIQAMRLCRRHGWVRASLQSGELSMTAAGQLETTFAGAERVERQCRTGRRNVGQGRCHDQDHDCAGRTRQLGLPAAPGEAGEQRERGPRSAPGLAPRAEQCAGDAAAVNTPVVPVTSQVVAQDRGAGHAGTLLPRPELNGNAALFPAPSCASAPVPVAGPAAPSSDDGPAPQLLPPTDLPASASASASAPVAEPEPVVPPRDTLRAVAPDRYTLKVTIDQECEQGLRLLKDLMSHVDPRMSWGDLVARLVREGVARHDPRGGGSGQRRRRSAGSADASPRRAPNKTCAAGAAAGPAQRVGESSGRAPNRTRATGAPAAPARRGGGATPAPPGDTAATERQNPVAMLASAAPPSQSGPAALLDGARVGGAPSGAHAAAAHAATSAPKFASGALADGCHAGGAVPGSPVATSAPERALGVSPDGGPSAASAGAAGGASAAGFSARAGVPGSPVATSAAEPALGVSLDGGPSGASAGAASHTACDSVRSRHQSPPRRHIPAAVRRHIWQRNGGRCCYRDPLTGRRCTSSHLLQIDHLLPVAEGGGPEPSNLVLRCFAHHRMRHGYGPAAPPEPPM